MNADLPHPSPVPLTPSLTRRVLARLLRAWDLLRIALDALQAPAALAARLYVGQVFFSAGLTKMADWGTTLALFAEEYHVPLLPPAWAAALGTTGELALPVLLVLGLGGRFAALGLSVVNAVAVVSLAELAPLALQAHVLWGVLLVALALHGPGAWSLDRLVWPWAKRRLVPGQPG